MPGDSLDRVSGGVANNGSWLSGILNTGNSAEYQPLPPTEDADANGSDGFELHEHPGSRGVGDLSDMTRLGKKQQFKRGFSALSTMGFISIYMATWEIVLISTQVGLINGGLGGFFWEFVFTYVANGAIVLSLAELASMSPTSGGQYHWVSEFSPTKHQRRLSYTTGWLCTLAWITSLASGPFMVIFLVESMTSIFIPAFQFAPWQSTVLMALVLIATIYLNIMSSTVLTALQNVSLVLHTLGFFVIIAFVWSMSPKNDVGYALGEFVNGGGWSSKVVSALVGQVGVLWCLLGSDSVVHISEEVQDASRTVPLCMMLSYVFNGALGFLMVLTMAFCISDVQEAINAPAPFTAVFASTGSSGVALFLTLIMFVLGFGGSIVGLTACSREIWAFARDNGLPFSHWIAAVDKRRNLPLNAIYVTSALAMAMCLINLGSTFAFEIIISLNILGFLSTYLLAIGCVTLKRLRKEPLPPSRFSLGRFGLPVNIFAVGFAALEMLSSCFPVSVPVTPATANWAPLIFVAALSLAYALYIFHGRSLYKGPVVHVVAT